MWKGLVPTAKEFLKKNSATIMTVAGCAGVIFTAYSSAKATASALDENQDKQTKLEFAKASWKYYIPTIVIGTGTMACVIGSNRINKRTQAAMTSAYILVSESYKEYQEALKRLHGQKAHNEVIDEIVKSECRDVLITVPGFFENSCLDFDPKDPEKTRLFYDLYSKRYFESSIDKVLQAEYHYNRNFVQSGAGSLNDYYDFIGLAPIESGDDIGWEMYDYDLMWVDFNHTKTTLDDGREVMVISFVFEPEPFKEYPC